MDTNMATNFTNAGLESPVTDVQLDWGKNMTGWTPEVKAIYAAMKDNPYSAFFYQVDVAMMRALCSHHSAASLKPDTTAAEWKLIWERWDHFGATMKARANLRYTLAKTAEASSYVDDLDDVLKGMVGEPDAQ